ncbi:MAG: YebC/PmpR family DNA-binding transcriptional regulator, partial [bacterium]|nr:YebC/PmpR family DNA-binding transcriptional regulator [bacterium]
ITVSVDQTGEDELLELVLESGGDDLTVDDGMYEIRTTPEAFEDVRAALEADGLTFGVAEITMMPQNTVQVGAKQAEQVIRLMDALEDHDDVRNAYANFDIADEILAALTA